MNTLLSIALLPVRDGAADGRSLLTCAEPTTDPYLVGVGDIDLVCPRCGFVVCAGLECVGQVRNLAFACQSCGEICRTRH